MRILIGLVIQIIAILFIAESTNLLYESQNMAIVSLGVGVALFSLSYFILHDFKNKKDVEPHERGKK